MSPTLPRSPPSGTNICLLILPGETSYSPFEQNGNTRQHKVLDERHVPHHIRDSVLFHSMADSDEDEGNYCRGDAVEVPEKCTKCDLFIRNLQDFRHFAETIRFWGSHCIPREFISFAYHHVDIVRECAEEFGMELPILRTIIRFYSSNDSPLNVQQQLRIAAGSGELELVRFLCESSVRSLSAPSVQESSCREKFSDFIVPNNMVLEAAAAGDHLSVLRYLHNLRVAASRSLIGVGEGLCLAAAEGGAIHCLKFIIRHGYEAPPRALSAAARAGSLLCLQYLYNRFTAMANHSNGHHTTALQWPADTCCAAACSGSIECMEYVLQHGARAGYTATAAAASNGHLAMLRHVLQLQFPFNADDVTQTAAKNGHLDCLHLLRDHKIHFSRFAANAAAAAGHIHVLEYLSNPSFIAEGMVVDSNTLVLAAQSGNVLCVEYLTKVKNCSWTTSVAAMAAQEGHFDCLQYAHLHGCPWDESVTSKAANNGHVQCLLYALQNNCPHSPQAASGAAYNGHIVTLRCLKDHGCKWDSQTTANAALQGQLECLQYAHQYGCPWNERACEYAARNGWLSCLQYAYNHGCPWDQYTAYAAAEGRHWSCLRFAIEHGCPADTATLGVFTVYSTVGMI